ncbi:FAD-dependent monooxygenase [Arthrobacter sp.]|uniref:FAD-dependent monooxygenase n=1 Tax=Arthrobacter sp. TaxID=1667 RepID=UPI0026DEE286|nr:FAD-dependent monooxygenase [Arthrobacter sp.]MDO5754533.1 hypothetical protein [Arthrobacter sp.]
MIKETGTPQTVVILGASFAGLFAAVACAGAGRRVILLERDRLPVRPAPRPGVPQGNQPHVFLHRGMLALEELLPGVGAELESLGAIAIDTGDLAWLAETGWSDYGRKAYTVLSVTRPLLEDVVRRRVRALPGIEIRDGVRVVGLHRRREAQTWEVSLADGNVWETGLVVDASGRSSRLPVWLKNEGLGDVQVSEVDAHVGYATRTYSVPPGAVEPAGVVLLMTPRTPAGGMALPVEGGRWLVTAVGAGDRRPPRDHAGFEQFFEGLTDPAVAEVAAAGEPLGDVHLHRQTGNRRHHYERLRRWPPGLLVVGDALCAFNPVYGQGITVAACQAVVLRDSLRNAASPMALRRLQRHCARVADLPWAIATGQDLRLLPSGARQSAVQVLFEAWVGEVGRLAAHGDARATLAMARVYHLMASPLVMAHPALLLASIRTRWRGTGPANPRPPIRRAPA